MGIPQQTGLKALSGDIAGVGDLAGIPMLLSPNRGSRGKNPVTYWVWHYTAGPSASGAISWLRNRESKASAHFVIGRDGLITQLVPMFETAFHAGNVSGRINNSNSIGVEIVNPGIVKPAGSGWTYETKDGLKKWVQDSEPVQKTLRWPRGESVTAWWVPYPQEQIDAIVRLVRMVELTPFKGATLDMVGHEDIAAPAGRKSDPGPLFPWYEFSGRGLRRITMAV